ncbi:MAG: FCD domain-containing protein [Victivallales bacterium]|jgi:DNA-binding FadR family transcriptional regulator
MLLNTVKKYITALNVGDKLPNELELAVKFKVSRGTLREIINHLTLLGVLERSTKRGTYVKAPTAGDIGETLSLQLQVAGVGFEELKETRLLLELAQVPLLIRLATPVLIDRLNSLIDQMEKSIDVPDRADALDLEFHLTLIEITGNRVLNVFSHVITLMFDRKHRRKFLNAAAIRKSVDDHRMMMKYMKSGDSENLKALIIEHIKPL